MNTHGDSLIEARQKRPSDAAVRRGKHTMIAMLLASLASGGAVYFAASAHATPGEVGLAAAATYLIVGLSGLLVAHLIAWTSE